MKAPIAPQKPHILNKHGHERIDNYYWLNQREDQEVIDYLNKENEYTQNFLAPTQQLQDKLYEEIVGRIKQNDESVPYFCDGYYFYSRYEKGKEYPIFCRKKESLENKEEILLDVNELAKDQSYCQVSSISVSPNDQLLAYSVDYVGRRLYTVYIKDLSTGEVYEETITQTNGDIVWANDNQTIFYTVQEQETLRDHKIFSYKLGIKEHKEVFHEEDDTFGVAISKSRDKQFLVITSYSTLTNECHYINALQPDDEPKVILLRERGHEYSVDFYNNQWYLYTNKEAQNFKLVTAPFEQPSQWTELIPHREDTLLESYELFENYLVLEERNNGLVQIRIIDTNTHTTHNISFEEETYSTYLGVNYEPNTKKLRYIYTSMTTPHSVLDYDMETREKTLLKQHEVQGEFDSANYETKRIWATAKDGTQVPMSIVYKKGINLKGNNPTLLYAYGSYGITINPSFSSVRLSLLDRGFIYAIAHIRGSEYLGRKWYEDGKLLKKMNTFTDFIDCAKHLTNEGYTSSDKLCAMGGSAGGMLMGGIVNLAPQLFKAIISAVPFVDVVTTMLDDSIPLTTGEYDEWGNPNEKEYYEYMLSYSPYDQVKAQDYPALLVTTGLHDSQVQYWEPAKWVAKLRTQKTDNNPLLLHTNMEAGHSGTTGRFAIHKETAMEYAFLLHLLAINS
ncbi:MAG: S9 family peptidase [Cytophagales bacterium]|nr:S9 family peptidase [Cytophagales bacterium]